MATGALIRDFEKDYRELRYSNSGSITLSEIEHNAYRAALTLEITHVDAPRYGSRKTLPDNTHYGYVTLFRGSAVTDTIAIKYPKFRVFDIRNQGIWNYHQSIESLVSGVGLVSENTVQVGNAIIERADDGWGPSDICKVIRFLDVVPDPLDPFVYFISDCGASLPDPQAKELAQYRAFPIATPFPDIAKFKADIPCSFLWRLELWYLVNPAAYTVDNPTDTGDETEGEDEYPEPDQGDGDGDGDEFPEPDPAPPDSDPRDFGSPPPSPPPPPPPFRGGQCRGVLYDVTVQLSASVRPANPVNVTRRYVGPIRGITSRSAGAESSLRREYSVRYGDPIQEDLIGALFVTFNGQSNNPEAAIMNVVRVDRAPDNCGDPPPVI